MLPLCSTLQIYVTTVQYATNLCYHSAVHYKFMLPLCSTLQIYVSTVQYATNLLPLCSTLQIYVTTVQYTTLHSLWMQRAIVALDHTQ